MFIKKVNKRNEQEDKKRLQFSTQMAYIQPPQPTTQTHENYFHGNQSGQLVMTGDDMQNHQAVPTVKICKASNQVMTMKLIKSFKVVI